MAIYELFKLSDITECDYESYAFTMTIGELIQMAHSSNIQRIRNPKKEEGIIKFTKNYIDKRKTPFFQPFILHYTGMIDYKDGKYTLDPEQTFTTEVETESGLEERKYEFEVIDGNGRTNSMLRLNKTYREQIQELTEKLEVCDGSKARKLEDKIYNVKSQNSMLKNTKIAIQLYVNLKEEQKVKLFNSVNQGETMAKGRLKVYDSDKEENRTLNKYIEHTSSINDFPFIITPDKDVLRTDKEREMYVPAVYILPVIRKLVKYTKKKEIDPKEPFIFETLDYYIHNADNPPHLRRQFFSILGSVIDKARDYDGKLNDYITEMLGFDYTKYDDVSKQLKIIRNDILTHVFNPSESFQKDGE